MKIRSATLADAKDIAAIHVMSWRAAYSGIIPENILINLNIETKTDSWRSTIEKGSPKLLVAVEDQKILGWAAFGPSRDSGAHSNVAELEAIYVHPQSWGHGSGKCLLVTAFAAMKNDSYKVVTLWVLSENSRAMRFYESQGFVQEIGARKTFDVGGRTLEEVRYRKEIN